MVAKEYQDQTLEKLRIFLRRCAETKNIVSAYEQCTKENLGKTGEYLSGVFPDVPSVCLRVPTGGGKTYLAARSINIAQNEFVGQNGREYPLVIWLAPTDTIVIQTYKALKNPKHPYREVLEKDFAERVEVLTAKEALEIKPATIKGNCVIIISTYQAWRQKETDKLRVYSNNGSLSTHFGYLSEKWCETLKEKTNGSFDRDTHSLANVICMYNPLIIIDEAHNARTTLSFNTFQRLNPSCIIEFTATPKLHGDDPSNVLLRVTASTLKAEHVIKLPIELHNTMTYEMCLKDAIEKQRELETLALQEKTETGEYIRPIVLIQAERTAIESETIDHTVVKEFLVKVNNIPEEQIAIVTGEVRELEGIDLNDKSCPIRYVITKEALREGWDCPFAYILCSVAKVRSEKDVEQLLGRVLRLPNVQEKNNPALNMGYAFIVSKDFVEVANNLKDSLIHGNGLTSLEASNSIRILSHQIEVSENNFGNITRTVTEVIERRNLPLELREKVTIEKLKNDEGCKITLQAVLTVKDKEILQAQFRDVDNKDIVEDMFNVVNNIEPKKSLAEQGITIEVPQLYLQFGEDIIPFDEDATFPDGWNLADCDATLTEDEFPVKVDEGKRGYIDVDKMDRMIVKDIVTIQKELQEILFWHPISESALLSWLVREMRVDSVRYEQVVEFTGSVLNKLKEKNLTIEHFEYVKFRLRNSIEAKIKKHIAEARERGMQEVLKFAYSPTNQKRFIVAEPIIFSKFYPVNEIYRGDFKFNKHLHTIVAEMNSEEATCATEIDSHPAVECWIKNIEQQREYSFSLPTSTNRFYPDFIVKLKNGKTGAIEYKGSHLDDSRDTRAKDTIGKAWEGNSNGRTFFSMIVNRNWNLLHEVLDSHSKQ